MSYGGCIAMKRSGAFRLEELWTFRTWVLSCVAVWKNGTLNPKRVCGLRFESRVCCHEAAGG